MVDLPKLLIVGSRRFHTYASAHPRIDAAVRALGGRCIVLSDADRAGGCRLGERYALEAAFSVLRYPPDWERFGNHAPAVRYGHMAQDADRAVVFTDGADSAMGELIRQCRGAGVPTDVVYFDFCSPDMLDVI